MYISNKDLEILQEIELYLYNINKDTITQIDNNFMAKVENVKDMYAKANWNRIAKKEVE